MSTPVLSIPVILGTTRHGHMSGYAAQFMRDQIAKRNGVETELIDIGTMAIPTTDAGEAIKDAAFSFAMMRADALVLVVPEYNHGYPGFLKHVLDTNLKEYIIRRSGSAESRRVASAERGSSRTSCRSCESSGW